ncbi:MAG: hypothetical protein H7X95_03850 [Deltaproteobacteria bacterium]|nr:hypothetical protein [Deltaproteobacteria bacterium]
MIGSCLFALAGGVGCGNRRLQAVTLPAPTCEDPPPTPLLDQIAFGDSASESAHAFAGDGTILGMGAFGESSRRVGVGAPLIFQLSAAPNAQNYLTVKLWGGDADAAILFLYVADVRVGRFQGDLSELDLNQGEAAYPGRFIYVTYPLPPSATTGKISVPLKIDAVAGASVTAAFGQIDEPLTRPTRPIYAAYVHTDPFFVPPTAEVQGEAPATSTRRAAANYPDFAAAHRDVDTVVATMLGWQLYGDDWNTAVAAGEIPAGLLGLFARGTTTTKFANANAWRNWAVETTTRANAAGLSALGVLAMIHEAPWSTYHRNPEILTRVVQGFDSLALMQGANGAFTNPTWVGAPNRLPAVGSTTEGSGTKYVGRAFVLLAAALEAAGVLDGSVDDDDNRATASVSRRQAWADMFVRHRDFLVSASGRSSNTMYDQSQVEAFWSANEAIALLSPPRALPRDVALVTVRSAVGLGERPTGGLSVSPKGLPLEPRGTLDGGYDGRWGILTLRSICNLAQFTTEPDLKNKCRDAVRAVAQFLYPSSDGGFETLRAEGAITTGYNRNPGFVEYGGNAYAADTLGDEVALRSFRLRLDHHVPLRPPQPLDVHFTEDLVGYLQDLPVLENVATVKSHSTRLPMESGGPDFAWTDEPAGNIAISNCGDRLYGALNWRRGFTDDIADPAHVRVNNVARIHLTRDRLDRIATIVMESPFGFGRFYKATYGPYVVGMNLSSDTQYELPAVGGGASAFDLVQRRPVAGTAVVLVPPSETRILYQQRP